MNVVLISLQSLLYYDYKRRTYTTFHVVMNDNKDYFTLTHNNCNNVGVLGKDIDLKQSSMIL